MLGVVHFNFIVSEFLFQILYLFTNDVKNGLIDVIFSWSSLLIMQGGDLDTLYTMLIKPSDTFSNMKGGFPGNWRFYKLYIVSWKSMVFSQFYWALRQSFFDLPDDLNPLKVFLLFHAQSLQGKVDGFVEVENGLKNDPSFRIIFRQLKHTVCSDSMKLWKFF